MLSVAVGWQIFAIPGRALDLGLIGLAQFIPSLLLALPAGQVADQFERRSIVVYAQVVEFLAIAVLAALTLSDHIDQWGILALVFVVGVVKAFEFPARMSLLPALVPARILPRAMAVKSAANQDAMIVGPALGGFLYMAGPGTVYVIAGILYLVP